MIRSIFATAIEALIAFAAAALFVSVIRAAEPPAFVVRNRVNEFAVVNRCPPCSLCDVCQCQACECNLLAKRLAEAKAKPFKMVQTVTTTTRAPVGHTHTCARCGTTWDHASNAGHTCPNCGASQYVQDRFARPVTVKTVSVKAEPVKVQQTVKTQQTVRELPVIFQSLGSSVSAGGCANGQCSTVTTSRGLFRWR